MQRLIRVFQTSVWVLNSRVLTGCFKVGVVFRVQYAQCGSVWVWSVYVDGGLDRVPVSLLHIAYRWVSASAAPIDY